MTSTARSKAAFLPFVLIVTLFFLWGVANNLNDVLIPHFKKLFDLTDLQSGLVQSAFYMGYFFLALPAGLVMRRFGYKAAVITGLLLFGVGALLFYPAAQIQAYGLFLAALFVIASGLAFLETSANPLITVMGDPATSERRLNFAQAFNPLGSIVAVALGGHFILSGTELTRGQIAAMPEAQLAVLKAAEAQSVQGPYLVIAAVVFVWAALVALTRFPAAAERPKADDAAAGLPTGASVKALLAKPRFLFGVGAQFFYVGAQVGIWSYMIRYAQHEVPGMTQKTAAAYLTASLIAFMIGRFAGTALMGRVRASMLLGAFAAISMGLTLVAALVGGQVGLVALVSISFFMSIMFPTIFANTLRGLGELTKTASSFLVMSIVGGAVLTAVMGLVSDLSEINLAILVPTVCFAFISWFGFSGRRTGDADSLPTPAASH